MENNSSKSHPQNNNSQARSAPHNSGTWKDFVRENILDGETLGAKFFDFFLILIIIASLAVAIIDSMQVEGVSKSLLWNFEIFFTVIFTAEYILRVTCAKRPASYIFSVGGLIDFISILPLYLTLIFRSKTLLNLVRLLRLLRIFSRLFKMGRAISNKSFFYQGMQNHLGSGETILFYFKDSRRKYFFGYFFAYLFLFISLSEVLFSRISDFDILNTRFTLIVGYFLLFASVMLLIRYELKILSIRYAITTHRVLRSKGIIHEDFKSTTFAYISDVLLFQSFWDRILFMGEVKIKTTGNDFENLELDAISNPMKIKKAIHDRIMKVHEMRNKSQYVQPVNIA